MERIIRITYLEMTSPDQWVPLDHRARLELQCVEIPSPELSRFLYQTVGSEWWWHERLGWDRDRWAEHLERPELETWVAYLSGTPTGYFDLEAEPGNDVQIAYFGLLPSFIGQGLGAELLDGAVERAWALGSKRIWLHTCSLDHPRALPNYQASGFSIYRTEDVVAQLPATQPTLWPEDQATQ